MNIKDFIYINNRSKSFNVKKKIESKDLDKERTVLINFGLTKDEDAIYSEANKFKDRRDYLKAKEEIVKINKGLVDFKKIFIINNFYHYENMMKEEAFFDDFFIDDLNAEDELGILIFKESANAFAAPGFLKWLNINVKNIDTFIITGFSLDTDIYPFVLSLKSFYKEWGLDCNILIDIKATQSIDDLNVDRSSDVLDFLFYDILRQKGIVLLEDIVFNHEVDLTENKGLNYDGIPRDKFINLKDLE